MMTRRHILEALRDGKVDIEEARQAMLRQGARNGSVHREEVAPATPAVTPALDSGWLDRLQQELVQSLAAELYMEASDIELDRNFTDMGLDSITGVEWINRINKQYGIKIPATKVYDFPTILRFADYLQGLIKAAGPAPASAPVKSAGVTASRVPVRRAESQPPAPRQPQSTRGSIAIVGMSGRYPGASDLSSFWDNLVQGKNSIREIPRERWNADDFFDPDRSKPGKIYCKWLGALDGIDRFDAPFFMISPAEAEVMDPQYRIFLEEAYQAFEDAGYSARSLSNKKCGVYMGVMNSEYVHLLTSHQAQALNTGNSHSIAAARISYFLNLKGPAIPIDTACSSSLVATHLACQALRNGEIEMALVGGVTLYLTPASYIGMCAAGMLSPDGQCKSFDDGANGFVPGEGAGTLVLKRLEDAERDGDCIHGVIVGSGINQDGRTNGITAPSVHSQIELERDVYTRFGIDPATIDYVETHGTGTKLGDPVELEALTTVFREHTKRRNFCGLGSVKSNIGHTSAAAGMAGVQKMLLCFKHQQLVPTLNFQVANTHCDFEDSPFYVNTETKPWRAPAGTPRRAAVSSMGFSGTNAHVVIEEYLGPVKPRKVEKTGGPHVIVLSSKNEARLAESVRRLHGFLKSGARRPSIRDFAYTLQVGRDAMEERFGLIVDSLDDLMEKLGRFLEGGEVPNSHRGRVQRIKGKLAFFEPDEAMAGDIGAWIAGRHWSKLLECWVTGLIFDWSRLYEEDRPHRVSLPTYPFARERYWAAQGLALGSGGTKQLAVEPDDLSVTLRDHGDGIYSIDVSQSAGRHRLSDALVSGLVRRFQELRDRADVRVVLLTGDDHCFLSCEVSEAERLVAQKISHLILECEVPVIAVMKRGSADAVWTIGSACDFMVCAEDGVARALTLAREIAQAPRKALMLLKRHLARDLAAIPDTATPVDRSDLRALEEAERRWLGLSEQVATDPGTPKAVDGISPVVKFDVFENGVVLLRLCDTASKNAFSAELARGVADSFARIRKSADAKVVVLTGFGNYFACGGTKEALLAIQEGSAKFTDLNLSSLPLECEIPVIAAMQGHGIGAGWSMGMFCDEVIFSEESVYHSPYLRHGFTPGAGSTLIFPERLGQDLGREVLFTAREYMGHELRSRGVKFPVLPRSEVLPRALQLAHTLARSPREALVELKATRSRQLRARIEATCALEVAMHEQTFVGSEEVRERIERHFGPQPARTEAPPAALVLAKPAGLSLRPPASIAGFSEGAVHAPGKRSLATLDAFQSVPRSGAVARAKSADTVPTPTPPAVMPSAGIGVPIAAAVDPDEARERIQRYLKESLADALHSKIEAIDEEMPFIELGVDSVISVTWVRGINVRFGLSIAATRIYDYPSVRQFAEFLRDELAKLGKTDVQLPPAGPRSEEAALPVSVATPPQEKGVAGRERVAIIGMSGRFPKAKNLAEFWENLATGRDCISEIPPSRWSIEDFYDPDPASRGKTICKWMGVLEDVDRFDPLFFQISPAEARLMDPQQRLFIESCWNCLEDAGINPRSLSGTNCGVFAGCGMGDYGLDAERAGVIGTTGVAPSILPGRISYLLNLSGPSLAIDTACSSSLVAIAQACDSLVLGNCDMALAGGVFVMNGPSLHVGMSQGGMLSPDGRCYTFDERANGFVPGEGVGVVLLKRFSDAVRDGDNIHGVIQGWGVNQDGKTNGITAPSMKSQAALERDLYARFGLNPESISLVEAHGTGTRLGDPIEIEALTQAFRASTQKQGYCALGSVKSNIGHLGMAAGIAGVLKVLLALRHRTIPPTINFARLNSHIPLEGSPFYVSAQARPWDTAAGQARRASVSSFGFSGTNAHLVIEEPPSLPNARAQRVSAAPAIVILSAKTDEALRQSAHNLHTFLSRDAARSEFGVHDIAYTLQVGREAMGERLGLIVDSCETLKEELGAFLGGKAVAGVRRDRVKDHKDEIAAFRAADKSRGTLEQLVQAKDYAEILDLWIKGLEFDWTRLYPQQKPRRVSLPGYPFARERHWLDAAKTVQCRPERREAKPESGADIFMARPAWQELSSAQSGRFPVYERHIIFLAGSARTVIEEIRRELPSAVCIPLVSEPEHPGERFAENARQIFECVKECLGSQLKAKALVQVLFVSRDEERVLSGLSGLLKTARLENPKLVGQLVEADADAGEVAKLILQAGSMPDAAHLRRREGRWQVPVMEELSTAALPDVPWKEAGVYLITGGAGGLGLIFAREIATRADAPTLILTGRSALNPALEGALREVEALGATVVYRQVDVTDAPAVSDLVRVIHEMHGRLDGVLHAAGVNRDGFILRKDVTEFTAVLAPKVLGVVNLDRATQDLPLDFFVLFSSWAGATGNAGQADYATANAFLDAFAAYRSDLVEGKQRHGKSISINWPLWRDGGMRVPATTQQLTHETTDMMALETASGIRAFYRAMSAGLPQVMVVAGNVARIRQDVQQAKTTRDPAETPAASTFGDQAKLRQATLHQLKQVLGEIIELPAERIESDEPLEIYGIDSVMVSRLNQELRRAYPEVSQTLFFEFQTLAAVASHLVEVFPSETTRWTRLDRGETVTLATPAEGHRSEGEPRPLTTVPTLARSETRPAVHDSRPGVQEPIAIIGICGRYAQAESLEAFWENLKSGKDSVTEVPRERWPLEGFFHADPDEAIRQGKSYSKWGGFLEGFAQFDPLFFNISPLEALGMDPQERLFLQASWEVLEAAAYTRSRLAETVENNVGVFAGITKTGFDQYRADWRARGEVVSPYTSFGSVANRVSYVLNLKGPSMPIDTMCSSSLTAIHEACEHLRRGDCRMAIAGGVNLYLHPSNYVGLCAQRMLSPDGKCRSFGEGGTGFVPGEGVGVVLLKPLAQALADGDPIHAVIRGTSVNHGGKTNGYTVPNPNAQRDVIRTALERSGIHARRVSCIEAHGTGTALGDPIEVTGLTQAFAPDTQETGFCALGSAKSNLGHLEAAAGIAGLTKVVLQMKHGKLAPSLHAGELNSRIPFARTPFVVQRELGDWKRPKTTVDGKVVELPRVAGVSSFGAGGANAHIIIEEPPARSLPRAQRKGPVLIVLSARTEARLTEYVRRLRDFLDREVASGGPDLHDLAYTLQIGREVMEERLALIVESVSELRTKLSALLMDPHGVEGAYRGRVQRMADSLGALGDDEDLAQTVANWLQKGKFRQVAELWIRGGAVHWETLHGEEPPCRMPLPTYPFAPEEYWIIPGRAPASGAARLHPMLHANTSDLSGLSFSATFSGEEFFLAEHRINGARVLPGVACLEMCRFAFQQVDGGVPGSILLKDVVWARPISEEDLGNPVRLRLTEAGVDGLAFSLETHAEGGQPLPRSRGYVLRTPAPDRRVLHLEALRAGLDGPRLEGAECYKAFSAAGMQYGPCYRGIDEVYVGNAQVLAHLKLPGSLPEAGSEYVLHPSLLDSALQSCAALSASGHARGEEDAAALVPYALDEVLVIDACAPCMWAWVRYSGSQGIDSGVQKLDIDLCDDEGVVKVELRGLSFRKFNAKTVSRSAAEVLMHVPVWTRAEIPAETPRSHFAQRIVLLGGVGVVSAEALCARWPQTVCLPLQMDGDGLGECFSEAAAQVFAIVRERLRAGLAGGRTLLQVVIPADAAGRLLGGLSGLLKTAHHENPDFSGQVIAVDAPQSEEALIRLLEANSQCPAEVHVRYDGGERQIIARWEELQERGPVPAPWRDKGVYLITGGAGGLGMLLAEAIANRAVGANVILCGRSDLSPAQRDRLQAIGGTNARIEYRRADVSRYDEVEQLISGLEHEHGGLQGIFHAAGILRDRLIVHKPEEEFREVLAPKVDGVVNLDRATQRIDLDFFVLFSAGAGILGNAGQADYAAANAFMDEFAYYRNGLVASGERRGATVSVDWPLWQGGGMRLHESGVQAMEEKLGLVPLETGPGLEALFRAMASGRSQVAVMNGQRDRLKFLPLQDRNDRSASFGKGAAQAAAVESDEFLEPKAIEYFRNLLSTNLRVPLNRIYLDGLMSDLGIDSVVVMNLTHQLEVSFGPLSKTLMFEHQTVRALAGYFIKTYPDQLRVLLHPQPADVGGLRSEKVAAAPLLVSRPEAKMAKSGTSPVHSDEGRPVGAVDIAIIGISGRYPKARNLDEYWAVLRDGRDCITEVPAGRWDWRDYYSEDPAKAKGHSSKWGGFIDDVDKFDPQFFNISPRIAPYLDPQERLILEEAWKALEDAGYRREDLQDSTGGEPWSPVGVYIGAMYGEYQLFGAEASLSGRRLGYAGNLASIANRLSYVMNLHGPSMMVDTMCSSSLTCIHLACQDLAAGRTSYGIAGGVNVTIHPNKYLMLSGGQFLSSSGRCESFGEGGAGYIPSEGVGVVLLKRLADAERDGDHIYGVIKGSAVNHGGRTHGYSVPNPKAQERVIAQALKEARIDPRAVTYIEAHGTGTKLGDPIEIAGLARAFGGKNSGHHCWLGSAKSNIGHCESAAGIAGLTKVLLQMKHRQIVPSLHSRVLNPHIDFEATPFSVNQELRAWEQPTLGGKPIPRIAGISSFGAGGANAHLLVEEYLGGAPAESEDRPAGRLVVSSKTRPESLIVLSAKDGERLTEVVRSLSKFLEAADETSAGLLQDLACTLQIGREAMEERLGLAVSSVGELRTKLAQILDGGRDVDGVFRGEVRHAPDGALLGDDVRAARAAVDEWKVDGDGSRLLKRWVAGGGIDWLRLYGSKRPRRISLPTYPFARKRFWVEREVPQEALAREDSLMSAEGAPVFRTLSFPVEKPVSWTRGPVEKPRGMALAPLSAVTLGGEQPAAYQGGPPFTRPVQNQPATVEEQSKPAHPQPLPAEVEAELGQPSLSLPSLEAELLSSLARALFMGEEELTLDKPFLDLGLDSIIGVEWVSELNKRFGLSVPASQVYEYATLRKFSAYVFGQLPRGEVQPPTPGDIDLAPARDADPVGASVPLASEHARILAEGERRMPTKAPARSAAARATDIAIIGFSGQFPSGRTPDEFWQLLKSGGTAFSDTYPDRDWDLTKIPEGVSKEEMGVTKGAFLEEVDCFDPLFFKISPKEATMMDPGERLFLQEAWKALEDAGVAPSAISGARWGVYCGNGGDYSLRIFEQVGYSPHVTLAQVPSRVSHCLGLTGPSHSVDAGCASALLAIAQACDHLVTGQCEVALAGGALIHSTSNLIVSASKVDLLVRGNGGGRALDRSANGMVPGEAVGVLVLKPLADALAAGDRIHGVIEGWGSNHNGKTSGMVSPSVEAEEALFSEVYERFGIAPEEITLVEASASGLPLADEAEVRALTRAFRRRTERRHYCVLGTVENNVGHAFHAAGMAHVVKVLLSLRHRQIPATPNVGSPHPNLELEGSPFYINADALSWDVEDGQRRRAAVSSFGATGVNVHLVIAEPPPLPDDKAAGRGEGSRAVLIALSAKTEAALKRCCRDLAVHLQRQPTREAPSLAQLSANLLLRRNHFEHRCAMVVDDLPTLFGCLSALAEGEVPAGCFMASVDAGRRLGPSLSLLAAAKIESMAEGAGGERDDLLVLADLYVQGVRLDMERCFSKAERVPLDLPSYPFEKRRCWIGPARSAPSHPARNGQVSPPPQERGNPDGTKTLEAVRGILAELTDLSLGEIEPGASLRDYGVDSLLGMRLLNRLNARFGGAWDASLLLADSIEELARRVVLEQEVGRGAGDGTDGSAVDSWVCPSFIARVTLDMPRASSSSGEGDPLGAGRAQLERLIAQGVGVWREEGSICFEFLRDTQTRESLEKLIGDGSSLMAVLDEGVRYFPVSDMQRMALAESEIKKRSALNLCQGFWVDMPVDLKALDAAFNEMVRKHSILRTNARLVGSAWVQVVHDDLVVECRPLRLDGVEDRQRFEEELVHFQRQKNRELFDVSRAPMLDVYLIHNGVDLGAVFLCSHHFHADGFTLFLFQQELFERYEALRQGRSLKPPVILAEYAHFALTQFDPMRQEEARFWERKLGLLRRSCVLADRKELLEEEGTGAGVVVLDVPVEMLDRLQGFNRGRGTTLTQLVVGALASLLYRLAGADLPIQMVYNLRDRFEFESLMGDFSSSLPMVLGVGKDHTLHDVLQSYEQAALDIQRHKRFDFSGLLEKDEEGTPMSILGDVAFDSVDRDSFGGVTAFSERLIDMTLEDRPPVAPLLVCLVKTNGKMSVPVMYDRRRFSRRTTELLVENLVAILERMLSDVATPVNELQISAELTARLRVDPSDGSP